MASSSPSPSLSSSTPTPQRRTERTATSTLYNAWAASYDHDSNVLQHLDDLAFASHVVPILTSSSSSSSSSSATSKSPVTVLDLGCGTGRNTVKLVTQGLLPRGSKVLALDGSEAMLGVAKQRISDSIGNSNNNNNNNAGEGREGVEVEWTCSQIPTERGELRRLLGIPAGEVEGKGGVDIVISTLVLEHLPLEVFFGAVAEVLKSGGWAWVTDMHVEMGESRAGFVRGEDGVKLQGESWNHGFQETVQAAEKCGLRLVESVEKGVKDEEEAERIGVRARKWVGKKVLLGMRFEKV